MPDKISPNTVYIGFSPDISKSTSRHILDCISRADPDLEIVTVMGGEQHHNVLAVFQQIVGDNATTEHRIAEILDEVRASKAIGILNDSVIHLLSGISVTFTLIDGGSAIAMQLHLRRKDSKRAEDAEKDVGLSTDVIEMAGKLARIERTELAYDIIQDNIGSKLLHDFPAMFFMLSLFGSEPSQKVLDFASDPGNELRFNNVIGSNALPFDSPANYRDYLNGGWREAEKAMHYNVTILRDGDVQK